MPPKPSSKKESGPEEGVTTSSQGGAITPTQGSTPRRRRTLPRTPPETAGGTPRRGLPASPGLASPGIRRSSRGVSTPASARRSPLSRSAPRRAASAKSPLSAPPEEVRDEEGSRAEPMVTFKETDFAVVSPALFFKTHLEPYIAKIRESECGIDVVNKDFFKKTITAAMKLANLQDYNPEMLNDESFRDHDPSRMRLLVPFVLFDEEGNMIDAYFNFSPDRESDYRMLICKIELRCPESTKIPGIEYFNEKGSGVLGDLDSFVGFLNKGRGPGESFAIKTTRDGGLMYKVEYKNFLTQVKRADGNTDAISLTAEDGALVSQSGLVAAQAKIVNEAAEVEGVKFFEMHDGASLLLDIFSCDLVFSGAAFDSELIDALDPNYDEIFIEGGMVHKHISYMIRSRWHGLGIAGRYDFTKEVDKDGDKEGLMPEVVKSAKYVFCKALINFGIRNMGDLHNLNFESSSSGSIGGAVNFFKLGDVNFQAHLLDYMAEVKVREFAGNIHDNFTFESTSTKRSRSLALDQEMVEIEVVKRIFEIIARRSNQAADSKLDEDETQFLNKLFGSEGVGFDIENRLLVMADLNEEELRSTFKIKSQLYQDLDQIEDQNERALKVLEKICGDIKGHEKLGQGFLNFLKCKNLLYSLPDKVKNLLFSSSYRMGAMIDVLCAKGNGSFSDQSRKWDQLEVDFSKEFTDLVERKVQDLANVVLEDSFYLTACSMGLGATAAPSEEGVIAKMYPDGHAELDKERLVDTIKHLFVFYFSQFNGISASVVLGDDQLMDQFRRIMSKSIPRDNVLINMDVVNKSIGEVTTIFRKELESANFQELALRKPEGILQIMARSSRGLPKPPPEVKSPLGNLRRVSSPAPDSRPGTPVPFGSLPSAGGGLVIPAPVRRSSAPSRRGNGSATPARDSRSGTPVAVDIGDSRGSSQYGDRSATPARDSRSGTPVAVDGSSSSKIRSSQLIAEAMEALKRQQIRVERDIAGATFAKDSLLAQKEAVTRAKLSDRQDALKESEKRTQKLMRSFDEMIVSPSFGGGAKQKRTQGLPTMMATSGLGGKNSQEETIESIQRRLAGLKNSVAGLTVSHRGLSTGRPTRVSSLAKSYNHMDDRGGRGVGNPISDTFGQASRRSPIDISGPDARRSGAELRSPRAMSNVVRPGFDIATIPGQIPESGRRYDDFARGGAAAPPRTETATRAFRSFTEGELGAVRRDPEPERGQRRSFLSRLAGGSKSKVAPGHPGYRK